MPKRLDIRKTPSEYPAPYPGIYDDDVTEGRRSLQQYFNLIYKRLPIILALCIVTTAAAAVYMYSQPSEFQSSTELIIEPRRPKLQSKESININFGNDINYYNTQIKLLQNTDLMKEVVLRLGLYREPNLFDERGKGLFAGIRSIFSSKTPNAVSDNAMPVLTDVPSGQENKVTVQLTPEEKVRVEQYASRLVGQLSVDDKDRTNLVNVSIRTHDPNLSAKVADMVGDVFIDQDAERETKGAREAYNDLTKSIEAVKASISQQEAELIDYMRSRDMPLQEKGQDLSASRLQGMSEAWLKAMEDRRQLEARYNSALQASNRGEGMNIPDLYENKIFQDTMRLNTERKAKLQDQIREIDKQIQQAEADKANDAVKYTDENPKIKAWVARIESLKATKKETEEEVSKIIERDQKKIEQEAVGGALVSLKSRLDAARKQEGQALATYEQESVQANLQGQALTKLTTLNRELSTNRNLLDIYTQRQKEQELMIASGRPDNIKITAHAVANPNPIGPQRKRNILVAFLVSLAAGIGLAFLLDYLDDSVKSSDDIGRHLGLPTLALIPHYFGNDKSRLRLAAANGNGHLIGAGATAGLITLEERHSPMAEAYRHLRTSLLFSSAGKPPQSILITSSQPSEGKTTTAINTAVTLAQSDAEVVIVDCDLRRPRLHSYFDLENTQGLTNYLSGERNTENLIRSCRDLPRLKVITSGPIPPNPAELLSSNEMKNLLQFLRGRFKHIIIDSPPAISFTDAAILATVVDGVVLVAMSGKSSIHLMRRFKQRLGNLGARIYGVVLNGITAGSVEYEYYGTGYYDYYAKGDADTSTPHMDEVVPTAEPKE
ncbi:MAG: polysaccharide biosynthesis tyrosine autokinase [Acidobacteriota bacterium]